jgi:tRNA (cmo5U34)-methyltransferase
VVSGGATPTGGWSDPAQVDWYRGRIGALAPRLEGERALLDLVPTTTRTVLDLGCGDGRLGSLVLETTPSVERLVAVDRSEPMLELARDRWADDPRVEVRRWDLDDAITGLGAFDLVVSGFAIHHVDDDRKAALYREIADQLTPGGRFANLEVVSSASPQEHADFLAAIGRTADDAEDRLAPVEAQLDWMRDAGLVDVVSPWRWRGFALLTGDKGLPAS